MDESHPDSGRIQAKSRELDSSHQRLTSLAEGRENKLQESLRVQEFFLQVDEEESWIREKEPLASSADYGRDVKGVVKLQQKHQTLEAEIQGEGVTVWRGWRGCNSGSYVATCTVIVFCLTVFT